MTDATKKDLERFIKELETLDADDPPCGDFQGKMLDVVQWGVYQRIVKLLVDLPDRCDNILTLDYLEVPHPADKTANGFECSRKLGWKKKPSRQGWQETRIFSGGDL